VLLRVPPETGAQDAVADIHHFTTQRYDWVLEADIEACFNRIDDTALMRLIRQRIADKHVLRLVKAFLKGVMTTSGDLDETLTGPPHDGILSPLLANLALSTLDDYFAHRWDQTMGTHGQPAGPTPLLRRADLPSNPLRR
jgi:RNA-directed DNA polymerase